ncbi:MAG: acyltransferase family protein [Steroidobacteraceae bacterium]
MTAHAGGTTASRHLPALDGIRGVAIIWVVFHNCLANFAPAGGPLHLIDLLARPGWIGVQIFFALSGFLITAGLLRTQGVRNYFSGFYARRALRILPLYYGVLLVSLVMLPRLVGSQGVLHQAVDHQATLWLFTSNWSSASVYGFSHFWSLAVEEQFYLMWPFLVYRLGPRPLLAACGGIALASLIVRIGMVLHGASPNAVYMETPCRMDALALGSAGACLIRIPSICNYVKARLAVIGTATFCLFLAGIPLTAAYDEGRAGCEIYGYTILAWSCAVFVTGVAMTDGTRPSRISAALRWRVLRSCGTYSYAMYVFHEMLHKLLVQPWLAARFGGYPPAYVLFAASVAIFLASYALAFVSYHYFERHFLALKRLFEPRREHVQPAHLT